MLHADIDMTAAIFIFVSLGITFASLVTTARAFTPLALGGRGHGVLADGLDGLGQNMGQRIGKGLRLACRSWCGR